MKNNKNNHIYGQKYYQEFESGFQNNNRFDHQKIIESGHFQKKHKILEIGCGYGILLKKIISKNKIGIETNSFAVNFCKKNDLNVILDKNIEKRINLPSNSYDFIILNEVIEHFHQPNKVLKECHRVLKNKGKLIITTPVKSIFNHNLSPSHFSEMNIKDLKNILNINNFKILVHEVNGFHIVNLLFRIFVYKPSQILRKFKNNNLDKFINKVQNKHNSSLYNQISSKYRKRFLSFGATQFLIVQKI